MSGARHRIEWASALARLKGAAKGMDAIRGFRLEREVGTIGRENVYEGTQPPNPRPLRIHVATRKESSDAGFDQCVAEHENAVAVVMEIGFLIERNEMVPIAGHGVEGERAFIAYAEDPEFRSLRSLLDEGIRLPVFGALAIMTNLLRVLQAVHECGVWHRNLTARSVRVDQNGQVQIGGYELASLRRKRAAGAAGGGAMSPRVAALSPEQISGTPCDERTDLFQAGMILYELLGGERPFVADGAWARAKKIAAEAPRPLLLLNPTVPAELDRVAMRALAKSPEGRFASAAEFSGALQAANPARSYPTIGRHIVMLNLQPQSGANVDEEALAEQAGRALRELQAVLEKKGAESHKLAGDELWCSFDFPGRVVTALDACRALRAEASDRLELRAAVHFGECEINEEGIWGDNTGITSRIAAQAPHPGIYFSPPAVAALPALHQARTRLASYRMEHLASHPVLGGLIGSPNILEFVDAARP